MKHSRKMTLKLLWVLTLVTLILCRVQGQSYWDSKNLLDNLFANYSKDVRPVLTQSDVLVVNITLLPTSILEVNTLQQIIRMSAYLSVSWTDEILTWNPASYNNLDMIEPSSTSVWLPQLQLVGTTSDNTLSIVNTEYPMPIQYTSDGKSRWDTYVIFEIACLLDVTKFPYDSHSCQFIVFANSYSNTQLQIFHNGPLMNAWIPSGEWHLNSLTTYSNLTADFNGRLSSFMSITLDITRQPVYFILNLLFPLCTLSLLNIMVFVLPVESGERVGFSITVLLSVVLYLGVSSTFLPTSSVNVPLVTQYITILTIISILCVVACVIIVFLHHAQRQEERKTNLAYLIVNKLKAKFSSPWSSSAKQASSSKVMNEKGSLGPQLNGENAKSISKNSVAPVKGEKENCNTDVILDVSAEENNLNLPELPEYTMENDDANIEMKKEPKLENESQTAGSVLHQRKPTVQSTWKSAGKLQELNVRNKPNEESQVNSSDANQQSGEMKTTRPDTISTSPTFLTFLVHYIDSLCFVIFLVVWLTVTLAYLIKLFT